MKILIGSTGLVGTTLKETIKFDYEFNSKNLNNFLDNDYKDAELYLSCLPATKWLVNQNIPNDLNNINNIINIISQKSYKKVIIISTIDVYCDSPLLSDESYKPNVGKLSYGTNRYLFEMLVENFVTTDDLKIFRLPALFNKHIKKNILFDLINNNNVEQINSNSLFQWYNLDSLSTDILHYSMDYPNRKVFNLFTEPLETSEIINLFPNHVDKVKHDKLNTYDYKTNLTESGYISSKEDVLDDIKTFIYEIGVK
jgi:nucleoside-diphosphate-sugar epimerase